MAPAQRPLAGCYRPKLSLQGGNCLESAADTMLNPGPAQLHIGVLLLVVGAVMGWSCSSFPVRQPACQLGTRP
jgi:hypothetical protein